MMSCHFYPMLVSFAGLPWSGEIHLDFFFQVREFVVGQGILKKTLEKLRNLKINGFGSLQRDSLGTSPSSFEFTIKGKNLLHWEQILSFKSNP